MTKIEIKNRIMAITESIAAIRVSRDIIAEHGVETVVLEREVDRLKNLRYQLTAIQSRMNCEDCSDTRELKRILLSRVQKAKQECDDLTKTIGRIDTYV
jgi:NADP-dependent 3-hydroxy acid dehydrogenase YdfG